MDEAWISLLTNRAAFAFPAAALLYLLSRAVFRSPTVSRRFRRGRRLGSFPQALLASRRLMARERDPGLCFGGVELPRSAGRLHFLFTGVTGSGKTLSIRLLLQAVIPRIGRGLNTRALVYDGKRDMLPILHGLGLAPDRIKMLNPFDARSVAWDMARDITTPAAALELAHILIPERGEAQAYFPDTARRILSGVLTALLLTKPGRWTFLDVVLSCRDEERLFRLLQSTAETRELLAEAATGLTWRSVKSTLDTAMKPFEIIAALWSRSAERISLAEWAQGEFVLHLDQHEDLRAPLDALYRVILKRASEMALSQPEDASRETWFFLDEVREAGRLPGLSRLLTTGRSKGVCVVLGFQDIDGLISVYGREIAHEIVGQCSHKAVLRLESPHTADWASSMFGRLEVEEQALSVSRNGGRPGTTASVSNTSVPAVLPSEFLDMPVTNPRNGLSGFYLSPLLGGYRHTLAGRWISSHLVPAAPAVPGFIPRPVSDQFLHAAPVAAQPGKKENFFESRGL